MKPLIVIQHNWHVYDKLLEVWGKMERTRKPENAVNKFDNDKVGKTNSNKAVTVASFNVEKSCGFVWSLIPEWSGRFVHIYAGWMDGDLI